MWIAVFAVLAAICAVGWVNRYISCAALLYYMEQKGYKLPTEEEIGACTYYAATMVFKR